MDSAATAPNRINRIVIVGGGTAGWMAAASLGHFLQHQATRIELIEAPNVPTVGVGEATIPGIRNFNAQLGIDEIDFIKQTRATFKLGIEFRDWRHDGHHFFHPFAGYGAPLGGVEFHHYFQRAQQQYPQLDLGNFCLPTVFARNNRFAQPHPRPEQPLADYKYAFQFDALLYAAYLRDYAIAKGVKHTQGLVTDVALNSESGFITHVTLESGEQRQGDLFIDCSGFRGLLIEQALHTGYEDWSHWLPVNRALAVGSQSMSAPTPYTASTARAAGWQWRIPLQHRTGNGYVYCSDFCSDDQAYTTLTDNIDEPLLAEPRMLRFTTGLRKKFWNKNCVALGLASGFLEPLESTSIALIQTGISKLLMLFPDNGFYQPDIDEANRMARLEMERIRDFLILHYHASQRSDGELWNYCTTMPVPDTLAHKIELFRHRGHLVQHELESFELGSWISIFYGMGWIPEHCDLQARQAPIPDLIKTLESMQAGITQIASSAPDHADFIKRHCPAPAAG